MNKLILILIGILLISNVSAICETLENECSQGVCNTTCTKSLEDAKKLVKEEAQKVIDEKSDKTSFENELKNMSMMENLFYDFITEPVIFFTFLGLLIIIIILVVLFISEVLT